MTNIIELLDIVRRMPTIMSAEEELVILRAARKLDPMEGEHLTTLTEILDRIDESHAGGTIFEVNDQNRFEFDRAADWLVQISHQADDDSKRLTLLGIAATLRTRF